MDALWKKESCISFDTYLLLWLSRFVWLQHWPSFLPRRRKEFPKFKFVLQYGMVRCVELAHMQDLTPAGKATCLWESQSLEPPGPIPSKDFPFIDGFCMTSFLESLLCLRRGSLEPSEGAVGAPDRSKSLRAAFQVNNRCARPFTFQLFPGGSPVGFCANSSIPWEPFQMLYLD